MNKVILMGRLTRDPEVRYTQTSNTLVASFSLAVNRRFARDGQQTADFIGCVAWRQTAEFICKYFKKGSITQIKIFYLLLTFSISYYQRNDISYSYRIIY